MTKSEVTIHEHYLKFAEEMHSKYMWSINEGDFNCVLSWIVKSDLLLKLKVSKERK